MSEPQEKGGAGVRCPNIFDAHIFERATVDTFQGNGATKCVINKKIVCTDMCETAKRRRAEFKGAGAGADAATGNFNIFTTSRTIIRFEAYAVVGAIDVATAHAHIDTVGGAILGMFIGAHTILAASKEFNSSNPHIYIPYVGIGIAAAVLLTFFIPVKVPDLLAVEEFKAEEEGKAIKPIYKRSHFTLGVASQFLYNAAQIGIFSFFINYAVANVSNLSDRSAGNLQTVAFGLFAGGRVVGSAILGLTKPHTSLAIYAVINAVMMIVALACGGWAGVVGVMVSFFFMSIMFPTIFALSIHGLGKHTKIGSSILIMSIVGGAIMTPVMGRIVDIGGMRVGFIIPLICFSFIAAYAVNWVKLEATDAKA